MSEHRQGPNAGPDREDIISGDDAFIDALSRGYDPSDGTDELAALLLGLREEIAAPMPPAPVVPEYSADSAGSQTTTVFPAVASLDDHRVHGDAATGGTAAPADPAPVGDLDRRRDNRRSGKHSGWFGHGLIGAAAATLIIAGGGAMVHSAQPGDSLWGINQVLFTDHAAVVELTATLEEADNRNAEGDVQGALKLLEQAKAMAQEMNAKDREQTGHPAASSPVVATATETVTVAPPPVDAKTVTVTPPAVTVPPVTQTVVVTQTPTPLPSAPNLAPGVRPTTSALKPPSFPVTPTVEKTSVPANTAPVPAAPVTESAPVTSAVTPPTARAEGTHISSPTAVEPAPGPAAEKDPGDNSGTAEAAAEVTVDHAAPVARTEG